MLRDPFSAEDEASLYVARPASEAALTALETALAGAPGVAALLGPVGIGKSLLLKVLEAKLASTHCCVRLDYDGLSIGEFCQWVLRELDARETLESERMLSHKPTLAKFREWVQRERSFADTDDPESGLIQLAVEFQGRGFPVALLIDAADALKPDSTRRLVELVQRATGALRFVVAITQGLPEGHAILEALGPDAVRVQYDQPMSLDETIFYIQERLTKSGASEELRACLDESRVRRLFKYSQGNPRRLHGEIGLIHLELSRVRAGIPAMGPATYAPSSSTPDLAQRPWQREPKPRHASAPPTPGTSNAVPETPQPVVEGETPAASVVVPESSAAAPELTSETELAPPNSQDRPSLPAPQDESPAEVSSESSSQTSPTADTCDNAPTASSSSPPSDTEVRAAEMQQDPTSAAPVLDAEDDPEIEAALAAVAPQPTAVEPKEAQPTRKAPETRSNAGVRRSRRAKQRITRLFDRGAKDSKPAAAASEPAETSSPAPEVASPAAAEASPAVRRDRATPPPRQASGAVTDTPSDSEMKSPMSEPATSDQTSSSAAETSASGASPVSETRVANAKSKPTDSQPADALEAASDSEPGHTAEPDTEGTHTPEEEILLDVEIVAAEEPAASTAASPAPPAGPAAAEVAHQVPADPADRSTGTSTLVSPDAQSDPDLFADAKRNWDAFATASTRLSDVSLELSEPSSAETRPPERPTAEATTPTAAVPQPYSSRGAQAKSTQSVSPKPGSDSSRKTSLIAPTSRTAAPAPTSSPRRAQRKGVVAAVLGVLGLGAVALIVTNTSDEPLPDVASPPVATVLPIPADKPGTDVATSPLPERGESSASELRVSPPPPQREEPKAPPILTNVNAKPWATIEIDGRLVGETPLGELPLSPGPHAFRATLPSGRVIERTEVISAENSRIVFE